MLNRPLIMANTATNATNVATLVIGDSYTVAVSGFTYVKDYAMIRGTLSQNGQAIGVIIGDKQNFGMRDMFELKNSNGIKARYTKDKIVNGTTYQQFALEEILF